MPVAGVDACPGGWYVAVWDPLGALLEGSVCRDFQSVLEYTSACAMIGIDIPIGLAERGSRTCDGLARRLLRGKASSVFPAPIRPILAASSQREASAIKRRIDGQGVGAQAFAFVAKVRQVDDLITPALHGRVVEVHPELCFLTLNGGDPVLEKKRQPEGFERRRRLLKAVLPEFDALVEARPRRVGADDVLDALVAAWTATRVFDDRAEWIPDEPPVDAKGLRMEMWY